MNTKYALHTFHIAGAFAFTLTCNTLVLAQTAFAPPLRTSVGPNPWGIARGYFDGDAFLDIAVANSGTTSNQVSSLLNNGAGGFAVQGSYSTSQPWSPYDIAVLDFDRCKGGGQTLWDLAVINAGVSFCTLWGDGGGGFNNWAAQCSSLTGTDNSGAIVAGRFNVDGYDDLAITRFSNSDVYVAYGDCQGNAQSQIWIPVAGPPRDAVAGDFNGDGAPDIAVACEFNGSTGPCVQVLFNAGGGGFNPVTVFPSFQNAYALAAGDFDGINGLDLAVTDPGANYLIVALNNGLGVFTPQPPINIGANAKALESADFTGDGAVDLAVAHDNGPGTGDGEVSILSGTGTGSFALNTTLDSGLANPRALIADDLDLDGRADVAATSWGTNEVFIYLNKCGVCLPGPVVYCTAKVNSLLCTPAIGFSGYASTCPLAPPFLISVTSVLAKKNGLFFHGTNGAQGAAFHGGFLCVRLPIKRHSVLNSGGTSGTCTGVFAEDFNAYIASGADPALVAGAQVWIQNWSRDPGDLYGDSLSDAIAVTICP